MAGLKPAILRPSMNQGFVRIVDRKKDMILVSGFNVYPTEIEDVIAMLPGVHEVAILCVPRKLGEFDSSLSYLSVIASAKAGD